MAQYRSHQSDQHPPASEAAGSLVQLRQGRAAREILGRPANDNRTVPWRGILAALLLAGLLILGYAGVLWAATGRLAC